MLRDAVIQCLATQVHGLGGRIYQAFLAPANAPKPYATVKMAGDIGSADIGHAGIAQTEVRIYDEQASFSGIDALEAEVIAALHGQIITDPDTGAQYYLQWVPGAGDFVDDELKLIGRVVRFHSASLRL